MIITTSLRENEALIARAQELAHELGADYQPRRKLSLAKCLERFGPFYLLYKDRLSFVNEDGSELSFHPDTAVLRIKAPHDALVNLLGSSSKSILDTTMGLASDSLVMAAAGNKVTALESQEVIFQVVSRGLATYQTDDKQLESDGLRPLRAIAYPFEVSEMTILFGYHLCRSYVFRDYQGIGKSTSYQTFGQWQPSDRRMVK